MIRSFLFAVHLLLLATAACAQPREGRVLCPDYASNQPHPCGTNRGYLGHANLEVVWDGTKIRFGKDIRRFSLKYRLGEGQTLADCAYRGQKTRCFVASKSRRSMEGGGLKYASPIAAEIPIKSSREDTDADNKFLDVTASMPSLVPHRYSDEEVSRAPEIHEALAGRTEDSAYFPVEDVVGGAAALASWKALVGRLPQKEECDGATPCSVVLEGKLGALDVLAYCSIMKSSVGIGLPYNCQIPVIVEQAKTYLLSYAGPEQCECGGAAGASCVATSDMSLSDAAAIFATGMKAEKTNIDLKVTRQLTNEITLSGKHVAANSKFFANYFEKAFALYRVSAERVGPDQVRSIRIEGLYNLLISADPSPDSIDYRDFGKATDAESNLVWLQNQIQDIIKKSVMSKIGTHINCEVINVDD